MLKNWNLIKMEPSLPAEFSFLGTTSRKSSIYLFPNCAAVETPKAAVSWLIVS
jgi:hypothetical protein